MKSFTDVSPPALLDWARWQLQLSSDRALAKKLGVPATFISRVRHGHIKVGAALLVRLLELTDTRLHDVPQKMAGSQAQWRHHE